MRILLVDDDELLTDIIVKHLNEQNYTVDIANSGETCLEFAALLSYDLILLDVMLPDTDGRDLCKTLRHQKHEMPILMLTTRNTSQDKVEGLDSGADDYLVKPLDIDEFMARIRALLRRDFKPQAPILEWEKLQLMPSSCEVTYAAEKLELTPKEYSILELFLRNTDRIHTLDSIIDNAWSFEDPPSVDAVRTHIKGLRQKLKQKGAPKDFIATIYGFGYRLKLIDTETQVLPKPEMDAEESESTHTELSPVIASLWAKNLDRVCDRIQHLTHLVPAIQNQHLTHTQYKEGLSIAHKLAGSLGCYGFRDGSAIALELEQLLKEQASNLAAQTDEITHLVQRLYAALNLEPDIEFLAGGQPTLLVISQSQKFVDELQTLAPNYSLKIHCIQARSQLEAHLQNTYLDAVLFDLEDLTEVVSMLNDYSANLAKLSVFLLMYSGSLQDRLKLVHHGVNQVFPSSTTAEHLLTDIRQVIHSCGSNATVLIVDDDPHLLSLLKERLCPWGFKVVTLDDATHFWLTLEQQHPDLVILDINMPQIDGLDLCQVMRADANWKHLPVLFLTAQGDEQIQNRAFLVGADDFIQKPVETRSLVNRIQNRLR